MVQKYGPEISHEVETHQHMQIVYHGKMRERQAFLQELAVSRKRRDQRFFKTIIKNIGPTWYHTLSVPQRNALDELEFCIYQDLLEGRPVRTAKIMRSLGLIPRPNNEDLMNCLYVCRDDPKIMLAELFAITYGHAIDGKRETYSLNAKLMLSAIFYLGLHNLIVLLTETFRPDEEIKDKPVKIKPKVVPPLASPYLQEMVAVLYEPPRRQAQRPPPLPNLDKLNEPYEEEPPAPKPSPPPPPPPPPKNRLPRSYCDKLAGIPNIEPQSTIAPITLKTVAKTNQKRLRGSKLSITSVKKTYGLNLQRKTVTRRRKPKPPNTGIWNSQYMINGVFQVAGKTVFVLGNVTVLPPLGDLIHGGYSNLRGQNINVHCGFRARPPPPKPDPCNCLKQWQDRVLQFVKTSKCHCRHFYDYGNEGTFGSEEVPFFEKPTKHSPFAFNYENIFELDPKRLHILKESKRVWDTESLLHVDDGSVIEKKDVKKKKKVSSSNCLGEHPKPEDYLKCALRLMKRVNVAARLPDVHLVPELKEWMRRRIYGPLSTTQKKTLICKSTFFWQFLLTLAGKNFGHVSPPQNPAFKGHTTWAHKQELNDKFRKYTSKYRLEVYRSLAKVNNIMWPTMFHAQFPDKKFREIYFSYLFGRVEDLQLMHPYSTAESTERKFNLARNRRVCLPSGVE